MKLADLITRLGDVQGVAQVVQAKTGGYDNPLPVSEDLVTALAPVVGTGRVMPLHLGTGKEMPNIVYQFVESTPTMVDGFVISQSDTYILFLRADSYPGLVTVFNDVVNALGASPIAVQITDALFEYDDDKEAYRANLELQLNYLPTGDDAGAQDLPALVVYPIGRAAEENITDTNTTQRVTNEYGIVILEKDGTLETIQDNLMQTLLGWSKDSEHDPFEYVNGTNLEGVANLSVWREIYRDTFWITET